MSEDFDVAVIGGSGFTRFFNEVDTIDLDTAYGPTSAPITTWAVGGRLVAFLRRPGPTTSTRRTTCANARSAW